MKLKKIGIGLLMLAGAVAMLMAIPKQVSAASDGNMNATIVVSESNIGLRKYRTDLFVKLDRKLPGTTNWWRVLYNKWRHGKR